MPSDYNIKKIGAWLLHVDLPTYVDRLMLYDVSSPPARKRHSQKVGPDLPLILRIPPHRAALPINPNPKPFNPKTLNPGPWSLTIY